MITVRTLTFEHGDEYISIDSIGETRISREAKRVQELLDMIVEAFGQETLFAKFLEPMATSQLPNCNTPIGGEALCVVGDRQTPLIGLMGIRGFVCVNFHEREVKQILELRRIPEREDHGFYHAEIEAIGHDFLVMYESGLAKIDSQGVLLWHCPLSWDDLRIGKTDTTLIYIDSFTERTFEVSLEDGAKREFSAKN